MTATTDRDRRWIALALLCMAQFVVVLDASIVNVALPTIGKALRFSESDLPWVVNAYVLTFGGFLLLGGRMADRLGGRRVFMAGLVLFALASLAGRAVQGLGAAILSPAALSIVTTTFRDGAERNKAFGVWGAVAGSGGAAGVLLGGVLTQGLGWEWVLWVNVPIGLIAAALAPVLLAEARPVDQRRHFDLAGAASITAALSLLVYALLDANSAGWGSTKTISLLAISVALLGVFVAIERRSPSPLVPFRIFRLRTLTGANVTGLLIVLLHLAVHAAGARLRRDQGGALLPAARSVDHHLGGTRVTAGDPDRLQAGAGDWNGADRARTRVVLSDLHARVFRGRHPWAVVASGGRAGARVRPGDDRRGGGRR